MQPVNAGRLGTMKQSKESHVRMTNLFAAIFLAGQLDFAHAALANGLAQHPFARLGRDYSTRSSLLRGGSTRRIGSGSRRRNAIAGSRGGGGSHLGMVILGVGSAAASSMGPRGFGAPGGGQWTVSARASFGIAG